MDKIKVKTEQLKVIFLLFSDPSWTIRKAVLCFRCEDADSIDVI